jgi:DNA invertase Pin-like site-specific DNA recombinase
VAKMKIGAAYIRVSTDDQLEYSPDSQIKLIKEYAKKNDIIIPEEFIFADEGISGKTAEKRPAFTKMIAIAKEKENSFDTILVWKFSRFARNQEESIVYKKMLKNSGVDVISISEPITDDPFAKLIERTIEFFDEYYLTNLSTEVRRGMCEAVSKGNPVCHPAFGYDMRDKRYYINKEEAPVVKEIFDRFVNGEKVSKITLWLQSIDIKTHRGNSPDRRFVEYILKNPLYYGMLRYCTNGRAASARDFDNENIIITKGVHEPIISQETFDKAQEIISENKKKYRKWQRRDQPVNFMLKGLLKCSSCGGTLTYTTKQAHSVQCHNYTARRGCTVSHHISLNKADPLVIAALKTACERKEFNLDIQDTPPSQVANTIKILIKKEQNKLDKIKDAYQSGIDTLEEYKENKTKIMESITKLKKELEKEQPKEKTDVNKYAKKVANIIKIIEAPDVAPQVKNEQLRSIISKIVFNKANQSLDIYFYV